ncbi:MAG: peptidylprolyl isomerase [Victivallales bacterium]|nr:peptidylprolyl isomerase [Victivallales bacterium]
MKIFPLAVCCLLMMEFPVYARSDSGGGTPSVQAGKTAKKTADIPKTSPATVPNLPTRDNNNLRVDSILAAVNGAPISLLDVVDESTAEETRMRMLFSGRELKDKVRELRRKVLENIIDRKLIVEDYRSDPFDIPREYLDRMLDEMSSGFTSGSRQSLQHKVEESGITLADLEEKAQERIIVEFMIGNLFFKSIDITPREVFLYYRNHRAEFMIAPTIRLEIIFLAADHPDRKRLAQEIKSDLSSGNAKIFHSMVKLYSDAPNAQSGGDLGWINRDKLRPEFAAAIKNAAPGTIRGPVSTSEGDYFIRVAEVRKGGEQSFDQARDRIEKQLRGAQRREAYRQYIERLRRKAIIRTFIKE